MLFNGSCELRPDLQKAARERMARRSLMLSKTTKVSPVDSDAALQPTMLVSTRPTCRETERNAGNVEVTGAPYTERPITAPMDSVRVGAISARASTSEATVRPDQSAMGVGEPAADDGHALRTRARTDRAAADGTQPTWKALREIERERNRLTWKLRGIDRKLKALPTPAPMHEHAVHVEPRPRKPLHPKYYGLYNL